MVVARTEIKKNNNYNDSHVQELKPIFNIGDWITCPDKKRKKKEAHLAILTPSFPGTIVAAIELDFRVRDVTGYFLNAMNTPLTVSYRPHQSVKHNNKTV